MTAKEVHSLVLSDVARAKRMPQSCRRNAVFLLDSNRLKDVEDAKSDLNGVYKKCLEVKTHTVSISKDIHRNVEVKTLAKKKLELKENMLHMSVNRRETVTGLVRNITYFVGTSGEILNGSIVMQYYLDKEICGDVEALEFVVEAHGNSKSSDKAFYPIKKSTLNEIGQHLSAGNQGVIFPVTA